MKVLEVIQTKRVDADALEQLFMFAMSGISFHNSFQVIIGVPSSTISKQEALDLKSTITTLVNGVPRSTVRMLLPALFIGFIGYGIQTGEGLSANQKLSSFQNLFQSLLRKSISDAELESLQRISEALRASEYEARLNSSLDPFSRLFDGSAPNSFSKAQNEFDQYLQTIISSRGIVEPPVPITVVEDQQNVEVDRDRQLVVIPPKEVSPVIPKKDEQFDLLVGTRLITITTDQIKFFAYSSIVGLILGAFYYRRKL